MDTLTRMRAFVAVVDHEGFSAAARALGRSKALLSKYVRELEDELGSRLLNRTTRQFSPTEAGHTYYRRAIDLLREFDDLQDEIRDTSSGLSGKLRISAPRTLADVAIGQSLVDFAVANPDLELEIVLDDRFVDMVEEGFDIAIRITKLEDSSMIARRLAPFRLIMCATPAVIEKYGMPSVAEDLAKLPFVIDSNARRRNTLSLQKDDGTPVSVTVQGRITVNSPLAARAAALADMGFVLSPDFIVAQDLAEGRLVEVMPQALENDAGIYAVYPHRRYLPSKVRALVDFLNNWFKKNQPVYHSDAG
ncbi:MAG: LysR family transcriptional regulator [Pseudomonadota bacterium]